jgi:cytoskeletal protein CcmA (bactofilin family)
LLAIKASAQISGDISCSKLIIEAGASFNGKSEMKPVGYSSEYSKPKSTKPVDEKGLQNGEKASEKTGD